MQFRKPISLHDTFFQKFTSTFAVMVTLPLEFSLVIFFELSLKKIVSVQKLSFTKKKSLGQKIQMEPTKLVLNLVKGLLITRHQHTSAFFSAFDPQTTIIFHPRYQKPIAQLLINDCFWVSPRIFFRILQQNPTS